MEIDDLVATIDNHRVTTDNLEKRVIKVENRLTELNARSKIVLYFLSTFIIYATMMTLDYVDFKKLSHASQEKVANNE